ncbi:sirohydrochlorin ferrochelatase, chloroplastic [Gossypium arboreum]|uniref:sirohydrochlorin ferrochelatase, chloroplastic n=1 Tax=Gossypium arboreum TaxID=29729 RepID=UPI000819525E|nr:sirohydrochlorin ferrochelatase, chloroplastic [Gossypium arboreum]
MMSIESLFIPQTLPLKSSSVDRTARKSTWASLKSPKFQRAPSRIRSFSAKSSLGFENGGFKQVPNGVGEKDGVIIVDHGSRRKESNLMLNEFVAMFREKSGYPIVEPAHMELAEPSIKDAFGLCVQRGANRVIVSPFFLFPGRHWYQDIPLLTADAAKDHPGVSYIITAPLGLHELLVDVMNDRIKHCLSHVAGDADECAACAGTSKCKLYGLVDVIKT